MGAHESSEGLATGRRHDQSIWILSLPLGIAVGLVLGWAAALITAASCLAGGLWLSPDLDTRSNALRRWGALGFLWWPYRLLIPHRSLWSHGPLLGTTARLGVLLTWGLIVTLAVPALSPAMLLTAIQRTKSHFLSWGAARILPKFGNPIFQKTSGCICPLS